MNPTEAMRIANQVTHDLNLTPGLTALQVLEVVEPDNDLARKHRPPLRLYDDEWAATIESRILQEVDS